MAQTIICDVCNAAPAAALLQLIGTGDVLAFCGADTKDGLLAFAQALPDEDATPEAPETGPHNPAPSEVPLPDNQPAGEDDDETKPGEPGGDDTQETLPVQPEGEPPAGERLAEVVNMRPGEVSEPEHTDTPTTAPRIPSDYPEPAPVQPPDPSGTGDPDAPAFDPDNPPPAPQIAPPAPRPEPPLDEPVDYWPAEAIGPAYRYSDELASV